MDSQHFDADLFFQGVLLLKAMPDEGFMERVRHLIAHFGSVSELHRVSGLSESAIRKWRDGEAEPSRDRLIRLAESTGSNFTWLATGEGTMTGQNGASEITETPEQLGFFRLGKSFEHNLEQLRLAVAVRDEYIRRNPEMEDHILMLVVEGDAMEPTLYAKDQCLIDTRYHDPKNCPEGIYAISVGIEETLAIRRVQRIPSGLLLTPDNPRYEPQTINLDRLPKHWALLGRVISSYHLFTH